MRENIHPKWFPAAKVTCAACGNSWTVGSTRQALTVDICSNCHPFYTGQQRIVDTEGQVDRFMKRLEARMQPAVTAEVAASGAVNVPLSELGLGRQFTELLSNNGIATANDFIARLKEGGDDAILEIRGVGRKVLTDIKKRLRGRGFDLPTTQG
jgi:large subunit ribosomal protein L31